MSVPFPIEELYVIDTTIRMFTEPCLQGDINLLAEIWESENNLKDWRRAALNVTASELASADRFAELLRAEGIEPEKKDGKNALIYAFAKTDQFMRDLLEHDSERVRTLAEARLGEKSTLMQTRAATLGWMARRGPLCVYLNYCGAGTLRPSGGDSGNFLNLKRRSSLRRALMAPEGYLLCPVDASQIEFRVGMYLAKQDNVIEQLRNGEDPYVDIASEFYGEKIYKPEKTDPRKDEMEAKRGVGKQAKLMCQYGAAGPKFKVTAKAGLYGPPIDMSIEDAERFVALYRRTHPMMCDRKIGLWGQAEWVFRMLSENKTSEWSIFTIHNRRLYLPNGCPLIYDTLEWRVPNADEEVREFEQSGYWRLRTRNGWKKMWGAKLVQNICEAVSRVIVSQAMNRITAKGYRVLNWPYDELLVLVPRDGHEAKHVQQLEQELSRTPDWLPGLPLACESALGERYAK